MRLIKFVVAILTIAVGLPLASCQSPQDKVSQAQANSQAQQANERGVALVARGDNQGAIVEFSNAINLLPAASTAFNNRGEAYQKEGDLGRAESDFNEAVRLEPSYAHAWLNLGILLDLEGKYKDACQSADHAVKLMPQNANFYDSRGQFRLNAGDRPGAIQDLQTALSIMPSSTVFRNDLNLITNQPIGVPLKLNVSLTNDPRTQHAQGILGLRFVFDSSRTPVVKSLRNGGSAAKAGLQIGDQIVAVDGTSTVGLRTPQIASLLEGQPNTTVNLSINRNGTSMTVTCTRISQEKLRAQ